jgi:hypothetical protein
MSQFVSGMAFVLSLALIWTGSMGASVNLFCNNFCESMTAANYLLVDLYHVEQKIAH